MRTDGLVTRALVRTVANETFSELFALNPVPLELEEDDWSLGWVAVSGSQIVGVMLTQADSLGDLWVLRKHRRQGIGSLPKVNPKSLRGVMRSPGCAWLSRFAR
jgi:hypothetical protein